MTKKASYALGSSIGLILIDYWGFDALADPRNTTNTAFALLMLAYTYSVIPAVFKFVGMPLLWKYPLTAEKLSETQREIEAKRAEEAEAAQAGGAGTSEIGLTSRRRRRSDAYRTR